MDIFSMRDAVLDGYSDYVRSFLKIADPAILAKVEGEAFRRRVLRPDALLHLNPTYAKRYAPTVSTAPSGWYWRRGSGWRGGEALRRERREVRRTALAHDIEVVWARIGRHEGETFHQKCGKAFEYRVNGARVNPTTTNRNLPKSDFAEALELVPLSGPGQINHLQGPSYIYGILMDPRISNGEW